MCYWEGEAAAEEKEEARWFEYRNMTYLAKRKGATIYLDEHRIKRETGVPFSPFLSFPFGFSAYDFQASGSRVPVGVVGGFYQNNNQLLVVGEIDRTIPALAGHVSDGEKGTMMLNTSRWQPEVGV